MRRFEHIQKLLQDIRRGGLFILFSEQLCGNRCELADIDAGSIAGIFIEFGLQES